MCQRTLALLLTAALLGPSLAAAADDHPRVRMQTSMGAFVLELDAEKAPRTVDNFLRYVREDFYDNTIFHRVIDGFVVQGGGFTPDYARKATHAPILNEADNGLLNRRGTIAMARTFEPHSATSQFFINLKKNAFLDHKNDTPRGFGYAVFGHVVEGMDVVDKIARVKTGAAGPFPQDAPAQPVIIKDVEILDAKASNETETQQ